MATDTSARGFLECLRSLPAKDQYTREDLLITDFLLASDGALSIYYAPFDHVNAVAGVVLVGVTPGWTQMELSFRAARRVFGEGGSEYEALEAVKHEAAFGGAMRRNLVSMLDGIGIASALGLESTDGLFGAHSHLVHSTSAVRYPVFKDGENYSGHSPHIDAHPLLAPYVLEVLGSELAASNKALIVPLGNAANRATNLLAGQGEVDRERLLEGFPHPSGLNPHRVPTFKANREAMATKVRRWFGGTK